MDRDLAAAYAGACAGCGFSLSGVMVGCVDCAARHPDQVARMCADLADEAAVLRQFKASWERPPYGAQGGAATGGANPREVYWVHDGDEAGVVQEEPIAVASTAAWAAHLAFAVTAMEELYRDATR